MSAGETYRVLLTGRQRQETYGMASELMLLYRAKVVGFANVMSVPNQLTFELIKLVDWYLRNFLINLFF